MENIFDLSIIGETVGDTIAHNNRLVDIEFIDYRLLGRIIWVFCLVSSKEYFEVISFVVL